MGYIVLIICGFSAGFMTAAAYVSFVTLLGVFPKIAAKTKTANQCMLYESCVILGVLISTLIQFCLVFRSAGIVEPAPLSMGIGLFILGSIGLFGGIYIGFLIGGLSEVLNVIPIYARIAHIQKRLAIIILFLALGKGVFTLLQLYFWVNE